MMLWFVFALMTAAAIFAVLWPLSRAGHPQQDGNEAAVYRDQLTEIDRDVATGLINPPEAAAARVEISRRLLAAVDNQPEVTSISSVKLRRVAAVIALLGLPLVTVVLAGGVTITGATHAGWTVIVAWELVIDPQRLLTTTV